MLIGITERGDAGRDLSWLPKLKQNGLDGVILITKSADLPDFQQALLSAHNITQTILHATITGWGGTAMEPNVSDVDTVIDSLRTLIQSGYPAERIVLRVDPVIPTDEGIARACNVLSIARTRLPDIHRIRISIYDDYHKAREEMLRRGYPAIDTMQKWKNEMERRPSDDQIMAVGYALAQTRPDIQYECCAEPELVEKFPANFSAIGCVSAKDLSIMNLPQPSQTLQNMQHRFGCLCLSAKRELLTNKRRCANNCAYCYWGV